MTSKGQNHRKAYGTMQERHFSTYYQQPPRTTQDTIKVKAIASIFLSEMIAKLERAKQLYRLRLNIKSK